MVTLRRLRMRFAPLAFALKWFWPLPRATSFPVRVTRMRLRYDLFDFMRFDFFFAFLPRRFWSWRRLLTSALRSEVSLDDAREPLWAPRDRLSDLIGVGDAREELLETVLKEGLLHALVATLEEEFGAHPVALGEPVSGLPGLKVHVMLAGANLDLDLFGLRDLALRLHCLLLLASLVFEFTIIHDLRNGRDGRGRDLDKVERGCLGRLKRLLERDDAEVLASRADHAQLARADLA